MRIRQLAKLSSLSNASSSQAHVCEFNQSPWDVMTDFSPPSSPLLPPSPMMNGNGLSVMNESSDASLSVMEWEDYDDDVTSQEFDCTDGGGDMADEKNSDVNGKAVVFCCKTDGKSWHCKREASYGNSMCEHHLALASKNSGNQSSDKKKKSAVVAEMEGGKKRVRTKKPSAVANPYEMYYYSGFGPRWGKKRRDVSEDNTKEENGRDNNLLTKRLEHERVTEPSKFINEGIDYIEDEDDDEEDDGLGKRKRARKPIKARSLKSLM